MLVTCHPPMGCDIGTMTAWTFGLSCCLSRDRAVILPGISVALVCSYCPVACDSLCDWPVACEWSRPNSLEQEASIHLLPSSARSCCTISDPCRENKFELELGQPIHKVPPNANMSIPARRDGGK